MTNITPLETNRLTLVAPQADHLASYLRIYGNPRVMEHIGPPLDENGAFRVLAIHAGHWVLYGFGGWAVASKATGEIVGFGALQRRPETGGQVEVGWVFAPEAWGKGYATEAARAILAFAFGPAKLKRVLARIARDNAASIALAERLGMRLVPATMNAPTLQYVALSPGSPIRAVPANTITPDPF